MSMVPAKYSGSFVTVDDGVDTTLTGGGDVTTAKVAVTDAAPKASWLSTFLRETVIPTGTEYLANRQATKVREEQMELERKLLQDRARYAAAETERLRAAGSGIGRGMSGTVIAAGVGVAVLVGMFVFGKKGGKGKKKRR